MPREREVVFRPINVIACNKREAFVQRSEATRQSIVPTEKEWIASLALAMTWRKAAPTQSRSFPRSSRTMTAFLREEGPGVPPFCYREPGISQPLLDTAGERGHCDRYAVRKVACQAGRQHPEKTECRIVRCTKTIKTSPAKGAMAIRPASLYWCGGQYKVRDRLFSGPAKTAREETCVN
jgi:hypothetical protein